MPLTAVSLEEYLGADYSPDVDYVDGEIEERNLGEWEHGDLQLAIASFIRARAKQWRVLVAVEARVQVSSTKFRVPDIVVVRGRPASGIVTEPPLLCIEILSPEDKAQRVRRKIHDYLDMGVACVWLIDPQDRTAEIWTREGMRDAKDGILSAGDIDVPLAEVIESDRE